MADACCLGEERGLILMKKGQIREGIVTEVKFPNKGVVKLMPIQPAEVGEGANALADAQKHTAEETAVVKNVLPGQKISVMINKIRKGKAEGRLLEVLEPSACEIASPCPHFADCGGCTYQNLPYEKQLELKASQVKSLLTHALREQEQPWTFEPIKPSPMPEAYRNKMEFSFGDEVKDGPLALGMHKRGSFYDIVPVRDCRIVDEDYRLILGETLDYFAAQKVSFLHRLSHEGYLRHLLVRKASHTGEILIALVTTSQNPWKAALKHSSAAAESAVTDSSAADSSMADSSMTESEDTQEQLIQEYTQLLLSLPLKGKITGILHIYNDSLADVVKSDRTEVLYGQDYFYEELLGLRFRVSVFSFFQTNSYGAEVLYRTARDYIGQLEKENCVVYDLYSGTGTIAQMMAPVAGKVIGVEIVEEAVEAARENAKDNGLSNCEFIAGDVLKVLDGIAEKPDFIILDPPRDGIHPKVLQKIIDYGVNRMVYISCKPTSLARDLEVFVENGYVCEKACCVDMFPATSGIETVCLLSKG